MGEAGGYCKAISSLYVVGYRYWYTARSKQSVERPQICRETCEYTVRPWMECPEDSFAERELFFITTFLGLSWPFKS